MNNTTTAKFGYVYGLDALRLFAVSIVIVRHYDLIMVLPGGFGVSIFFFISGFLISRLLFAEQKKIRTIHLARFYVRRFIRLLPPLLLMGVVVMPLLYFGDPRRFSWIQAVLSFAYLGNIAKFGGPLFGWKIGYPSIEPLWSLAVEEHFYLVLPPLLLLVKSPRARAKMLASAIALSLVLRVVIYEVCRPYLADQINYHFTLTRLDSLAFGVLFSLLLDEGYVRVNRSRWVGHLAVWGGGAAMILTMVHWTPMYEIALKYTVESLSIGAFFYGVIYASNYDWLRKLMELRPIVHLGRISYELYLWHFPILSILLYYVTTNRAIAVPMALVCTLLVAEVAYRLTTKRLAGVRRRFGAHPVS